MLLLMRKLRHRGETAFLCQNKSAQKQEVSLRALVPAQSPAFPPLCLLTLLVPPCSCSFPEGLELLFDTLCAGAQGSSAGQNQPFLQCRNSFSQPFAGKGVRDFSWLRSCGSGVRGERLGGDPAEPGSCYLSNSGSRGFEGFLRAWAFKAAWRAYQPRARHTPHCGADLTGGDPWVFGAGLKAHRLSFGSQNH